MASLTGGTATKTCEKPGCDSDAEKTYRGENRNKLRLCERHYYNLVTDGKSTGIGSLGIGIDRPPAYEIDPNNPEPVKIPTPFEPVDREELDSQPSIWSDAMEEVIKKRTDS